MAYSGKYNVTNKKKYKGDFDNIVYRSSWEYKVFEWCDANPKVKALPASYLAQPPKREPLFTFFI